MIKLSKGPEPKVLTDNSVIWTAALLAKISSGGVPTPTEKTRYRHKDIKAALEKETFQKCAYCESKLKHIHHGDVEHIYPKSLNPSKQFLWSNLTLACEVCNQNKSNRDPELECILDPYTKDPQEHICFFGAMAFPLGTAEGTSSISLLELNRPELVVMRVETVKRVMGILETILRPDIPLPAKKVLLLDFETNELGPNAQYSAVVSAVYSAMKSRLSREVS